MSPSLRDGALWKTHSLARRAHFIRGPPTPSRQGQRPRSSHLAVEADAEAVEGPQPEPASAVVAIGSGDGPTGEADAERAERLRRERQGLPADEAQSGPLGGLAAQEVERDT